MAHSSADDIITAAREAARATKQTEDDARARSQQRRIDQVTNFAAKRAPELSRALARKLGQSPDSDAFTNLTWYLSKEGEQWIEFRGDDELYINDTHLPTLVTNFGGYSIQANGFTDGTGIYSFALSSGGSSYGFVDAEDLGRILEHSPNVYRWENETLSQYTPRSAQP